MPIYDYRCRKCSKETEIVRTVMDRDQPLPDSMVTGCSDGNHEYVRVIKGVNFQLLGGGWYKDSYGKDKK